MVHDDYLRCVDYQNKPAHPKEAGFVAFYNEAMDRHFFALLDKNRLVMLRSEAYVDEKSRDNGIKSVLKNRTIAERYAFVQEGNFHYLVMRAGNRKEIARSCEMETGAQARALMQKLMADDFEQNILQREAAPKKAAAPKAEKTAAKKPAAKKETAETAPAAENGNPRVAAPERSYAAEYSAVHVEYTDPETGIPYPALDHYYGHATLTDEHGRTGYAVFSGADQKHYFVVYNADGSIYLRSAGFNTAKERDSRLDEVRRFIVKADHYRVLEVGDKYAVSLVDDGGKELSRSGLYDSFTEAFSKTPASHQMPGSGNVY